MTTQILLKNKATSVISNKERRRIYYQRLKDITTKHKPGKYSENKLNQLLDKHEGEYHKLYLSFAKQFKEEILPPFGKDKTKDENNKSINFEKIVGDLQTDYDKIKQLKQETELLKMGKRASSEDNNNNTSNNTTSNNKKTRKRKKASKKKPKNLLTPINENKTSLTNGDIHLDPKLKPRKNKRRSMIEMLRKNLVVENIESKSPLEEEEKQDTKVHVVTRFRPINKMEKKHEMKLLFKTEFDMDDKDYKLFMKHRQQLLLNDKNNKLDKNLDMWTLEDCCNWLDEHKLEEYKKRFRRRKINGPWLKEIPKWNEKKPLEIDGTKVIAFTRGDQSHAYELDGVLGSRCTQRESFKYIGEPLVENILNGFNATLFAYGQTGTGKTHTMFGPEKGQISTCKFTQEELLSDIEEDEKEETKKNDNNSSDDDDDYNIELSPVTTPVETPLLDSKFDTFPSTDDRQNSKLNIIVDDNDNNNNNIDLLSLEYDNGIIPASLKLLFDRLQNDQDISYYDVQMAFIEIYQEKLRDLLKPRLKLTLRYIGRDSQVDNLSWWDVSNFKEAYSLILKSRKNRKTASTKQNLTSSRSHCIIQCKIEMTLRDGTQQNCKLNFGDLAGSEKITKTGAKGQRLREATKIVQSLFALKKVIRALSEKKAFVPYQDSVLTKLLRDSLGGNSKTTIIVCNSPHAYNREETLSTLRFAEMAKKIKNEAKVNRLLSRDEMESHIKELQDQLQYIRKQRTKKSRFTSTDFRVLHMQLGEMAEKAEQYQQKYLQSEIQLLVKTQYIQELEKTLNERNKILVKCQDELDKAKIIIKKLKKKKNSKS